MFFTYLRRELRRRSKQAIVVAIGLAIGIGLVMTVSAASAGVKNAQGQVLHSLYGVGTDITVTKTATFSGAGGQHFGGFGNGGSGSGSRPKAGTKISRNTLRPSGGEAKLPASDVTKIASVKGVAAASGGLVLSDTSFSGTIPDYSGGSSGGGYTPGAGGGGPSFNINSFSVDGVQLSGKAVGPLTASEITKGSYFSSSDNTADVAVVSSSYASQHSLKVGSKVTVAGKKMSVIGVTSATSADVYLPLGTAQKLAGLKNDVTIVYVSATSASAVSSVASSLKSVVPKATITTSASLASEVSGSITSASSLATNLGRWLSIAALIVAFIIAGLLMMAAVSRRVREFGTLKAIGWRTKRIVGQVMGEGLTLGLAGGVMGILLGLLGGEIVSAVSPSLSATVGSSFATGGSGGFGGAGGGGGGFGGAGGGGGGYPGAGGYAGASGRTHSGFANAAKAFDDAHTVLVHLSAPIQGGTILIAVLLAVAGGLVAGGFGSWRAARLRPAAALRRVE